MFISGGPFSPSFWATTKILHMVTTPCNSPFMCTDNRDQTWMMLNLVQFTSNYLYWFPKWTQKHCGSKTQAARCNGDKPPHHHHHHCLHSLLLPPAAMWWREQACRESPWTPPWIRISWMAEKGRTLSDASCVQQPNWWIDCCSSCHVPSSQCSSTTNFWPTFTHSRHKPEAPNICFQAKLTLCIWQNSDWTSPFSYVSFWSCPPTGIMHLPLS